MKNFYSFFVLLLLMASCSSDTDIAPVATTVHSVSVNGDLYRGGDLPSNPDNAYDAAGRLHNELFEAYYLNNPLPGTLDSIASLAETTGTANTEFQSLKGTGYVAVSSTAVANLITNSSTCVADVIAASSLSSQAKLSLSDFIYDVIDLDNTESDYEVVYNFIYNYESSILQNGQLTQGDKKIILTTTSIARYTSYMRRKKPKSTTDADWTIFITSLAGAVEGATSGTAEAIMKAFVTGAAHNNL